MTTSPEKDKMRVGEMGVVVIAVVRKFERYNGVKMELNDNQSVRFTSKRKCYLR